MLQIGTELSDRVRMSGLSFIENDRQEPTVNREENTAPRVRLGRAAVYDYVLI
ncbi:hypothetical protein Brsp01_45790 [Brucella sp. NBRC 12950]|nr:hypothetical protein Brsp01_45790 [Brucella sp. NBRC 12950]